MFCGDLIVSDLCILKIGTLFYVLKNSLASEEFQGRKMKKD